MAWISINQHQHRCILCRLHDILKLPVNRDRRFDLSGLICVKRRSFGIITQYLKCRQHPILQDALVILEWIWNRGASLVMSAARYAIKQKSCTILFIACLYVSVKIASGNELVTSHHWNVFGNTGAGNQNTLTGGVPKFLNIIVSLCFKEGDNFRNIASEVTQPASQRGSSLAPAGETIRAQGDDNASRSRDQSSKKHESYLYDDDESVVVNLGLLVVYAAAFLVGMLIMVVFIVPFSRFVRYLFSIS